MEREALLRAGDSSVRLRSLESELEKMRRLVAEQERQLRLRAAGERRATQLASEIENMKAAKVYICRIEDV